ncbi:hypothetical protein PMAYCL1PPCAC_14866, partial [Pristionchus mayeri]
IIVVCILVFFTATLAFTFFPFSKEDSERLIDESRFYLSWVRTRGVYFRFPTTTFVHGMLRIAILCLLVCMAVAIVPFLHMLHVLNKEVR